MITAKVETITRETAQEYLGKDKGNNRPLSLPHVLELIGKQKRGEWKTNGDVIRFDTEGQLRDGQHRLKMVEQTGIPIEVVVVKNIDVDAFSTMDTGKKRSFADVLSIEHEDNARPLALTIQFVWKYLSRNLKLKIGSYEEMIQLLKAHPEIRKSVKFYLGLKEPSGAPGFPPITMAAHYLFSRVDKDKANDFIARYVNGLAADLTDPIHVIREQIIFSERQVRPIVSLQAFTLLVKAWNCYIAEKPAKKKFQVQRITEIVNAPRIDGGFPKELFFNRQTEMELLEEETEPS